MKTKRIRIAAAVFGATWCTTVPADAGGIIIGYSNCQTVASLSQTAITQIAQLRWYFAHASVGSNMRDGLTDLHSLDATQYPLIAASDDGAPPANPSNGVVYDYARGNPGWLPKVTNFTIYVQNGWRFPRVNIAANKFCYIDQDADVTTYLNAMRAMETNCPETVFVYMTIPLTTAQDTNNYLRTVFNDTVRAWVATNGSVLFDIADIECHDTNGIAQTYLYGGRTCQRLFAGYSTDGGHLDDAAHLGRDLVAKGFYALGAALFQADRDGDGASDGNELTAGTRPTQAGSVFRVTDISIASTGTAQLTWSSASNRIYAVQHAGDLTGSWANLVTNVAATPPVNTCSDTNSLAAIRRFYRVLVRQ